MNTSFSANSVRRISTVKSTNSVQFFVRFFVWIISFLILGIVLIMIKKESVQGIEGFQSLGFFSILFNAWIAIVISGMFHILPEWYNMVLLKLGKFDSVRKAGFFIIPPFIYSVASIVDIRIETRQVEATNTLTKDNVPTKVTAAVEFRVEDPRKAVIDVQNYRQSVIWLATEALKNTIGSMTLKELLGEREQIAVSLKEHIDKGAVVYGIDVRAVRITDIENWLS
jgi:regulator of protease activity HflC (stomatin/prohibitin superfamily)